MPALRRLPLLLSPPSRGRVLRSPALWLAAAGALLAAAAPARAGEGDPPPPAGAPAPAPAAAPAPPAPAKEPAAPAPWARDLAAAKAAAAERRVRILAVVTESFYPSEPCDRLAAAVLDPAAAKAAGGFALLRIEEKEDLAFSKGLGLEDLGHPYTALLDAEGRVVATLRGARGAEAWAREVARLSAAADALDEARAAAAGAPGDARTLWRLSEALRDLGRTREADDALARAENADPEGKSGLAPHFAFRRLEALVEDRMAVQDFEGARAALDGYDREHPSSPRRRLVFLWRALCRAHLGEAEAALEDLREVAAEKGDEALAALAAEKAAALEKVIAARK